MAIALVYLGLAVACAGGIWFLIKAFQTDGMWGCGVLLPFIGGLISIVFLIKYWSEAKKPFLTQVAGWVIMLMGINLAGRDQIEWLMRSLHNDPAAYSEDSSYSDYDDEDDDGTLASRPSLATPPVESAGELADPLDDIVSDLPTDTGLPAPPPSPTAGRFQRREKARVRRGSVTLDNVGRFLGSKVKITKNSSKTIVGYLIDVTDTHIIIEERMGGGRLSYPIAKSTIRSIELATN